MFFPTPYCSIVPPYLLRRLAAQSEPELSTAARAAKEALHHVPSFQASRAIPSPVALPGMRELKPSPPERTVYDAKFAERLPGTVVRKEGEPPTGDPAADENSLRAGTDNGQRQSRWVSAFFRRDQVQKTPSLL